MRPDLSRVSFSAALLLMMTLGYEVTSAQVRTAAAAPLPPAAYAALNSGIAAAKQSDYAAAVRLLGEARKLAPASPIVLYNLGVVESKMPGRELRAIAWLAGYLASAPAAANATSVKEQIARLDAKSRGDVSRLIQSIEEVATRLDADESRTIGALAGLYADAGDIAAAEKAAGRLRTNNAKADALNGIAFAQLVAGDVRGGRKTLASAADAARHAEKETADDFFGPGHREAQLAFSISSLQARAGDIDGAQRTAARIDARFKQQATWAQEAIASARSHPVETFMLFSDAVPGRVTAADWLRVVEDEKPDHPCALSAAWFLSPAAFLKKAAASTDAMDVFEGLHQAASNTLHAQLIIRRMLRQ